MKLAKKFSTKEDSLELPRGFTEQNSLLSSLTRIKKFETPRPREDEIERLVQERLKQIISPGKNLSSDPGDESQENFGELTSNLSTSELTELKCDTSWNDFVFSMAENLGICCSNTKDLCDEKSYINSRLIPPKEKPVLDIPLDGAIIKELKRVDQE